MMTYEETTMSNPMRESIIPFFAFSGSFPELAAKINMIPDTISVIVTTVQIKKVAESTISWTNNPTDVA